MGIAFFCMMHAEVQTDYAVVSKRTFKSDVHAVMYKVPVSKKRSIDQIDILINLLMQRLEKQCSDHAMSPDAVQTYFDWLDFLTHAVKQDMIEDSANNNRNAEDSFIEFLDAPGYDFVDHTDLIDLIIMEIERTDAEFVFCLQIAIAEREKQQGNEVSIVGTEDMSATIAVTLMRFYAVRDILIDKYALTR